MCELLAPAGNFAALKATVANGANAVYVGGKSLSARSFADNFNDEEMQSAIDYCHVRGVKLYVAVNTMIKQSELEGALYYAEALREMGADALIVSDLGLGTELRRLAPDMPLHASTQMCIHNVEGVRAALQAGFCRVVLARELSLSEIEKITSAGIAEIEVFVHGALCSCVSGLCLMSSFIGGRSGNRGKCAQPCRLEYEINGKKAYHLSTADLNAEKHIKTLIEMGVTSFKIEGRMKSESYVGGVTREYRRLIDAAQSGESYTPELDRFYNRSFTDGYLTGTGAVTAPEIPSNRNLGGRQKEVILEGEYKKNRADMMLYAFEGERARLRISSMGESAEITGEAPLERAVKPFSAEMVKEALQKTGGTPFEAGEVQVETQGEPFLSRSECNSLRRGAIDALEKRIAATFRRSKAQISDADATKSAVKTRYDHELKNVCVATHNTDIAIYGAKKGVKRIYLTPTDYKREIGSAAQIFEETGVKPFIFLPSFMHDADENTIFELIERNSGVLGGALCGNISHIKRCKALFKSVLLDMTQNTANRSAAAFAGELGATGAALSCELSARDIGEIKCDLETEIAAYGRIPLMWIARTLSTDRLKDRRGYVFPVEKITVEGELDIVKNAVMTCITELLPLRKSVDAVRLYCGDGDEAVIDEYIAAVREKRDVRLEISGANQGHIKRGV